MRANEFINEEINTDVFNPAFNDTQEFDGLTYRATAEEGQAHTYFVINVLDDNYQRVGLAKFKPSKDDKGKDCLESLITSIHPDYQGKNIASNIYAYVRMLGNTIKPSTEQLPAGKAMWQAWKKSGEAEHLMKEQVVSELFDPETAFPLKWDKQFAGQGEFHAEAYDADGRIIGISFTPVGDGNATEVVFTRGGTHEMTGKGDAARVMATVINAINIFIQKYKPPYLVFSAKSTGGRASAYTAMIKRVARGYKLLSPDEYPEELGSYFEFIGSDQPFVLARV